MSIMLQNEFKDKAQKFFPISAKDIDEETIDYNRLSQEKGAFIEEGFERTLAELSDPDKTRQYIIPDTNKKDGFISKKVRNTVEFSCANILTDIENIDPKSPTILMCRNMWPYINEDEYKDYAKSLYERLAPGSIVILGEYDILGEPGLEYTEKFSEALKDAGFEKPMPWLDERTPNLNHNYIFERNKSF